MGVWYELPLIRKFRLTQKLQGFSIERNLNLEYSPQVILMLLTLFVYLLMNVADYYSKAHVTFLPFSRTAIFAHEHQCLTIRMCLIPPKYSAETTQRSDNEISMISDVEQFDERLEAWLDTHFILVLLANTMSELKREILFLTA